MRKQRQLAMVELHALERLRRLASRLDGSVESSAFGHPTFKAGGRAFAVLDAYGGIPCLWLRIGELDRERLLATEGWSLSPYDPRRNALVCRLDAIDWRRIQPLVRASHRLAAPAPTRRRR